ncbi:MAG TPA: hypothetical protein VGF01_00495 [Terracidiphilus sp.]|jgi:hypothetical protein
MRVLSSLVLAIMLLSTVIGCRRSIPDFVTAAEKNAMQSNKYLSQQGIGLVRHSNDGNLYVSTVSRWNELTWEIDNKSHNWKGLRSTSQQIVVFWNGKIWYPWTLPREFDRNNSVVISFERNHVRFYDFAHNSGGYFEKYWQD